MNGTTGTPTFDKKVHMKCTMSYGGSPHTLRIWRKYKLGGGGFGSVFSADLFGPGANHARQTVAVKVLNIRTEVAMKLFESEVETWKQLSHQRILPFLGETDEFGVEQFGLVSPLITNGNMMNYVSKHPNTDVLRLLREVAEGMEYLHIHASIVHGDLKCANVLVSTTGSALLADFGLSTFVERNSDPTETIIRIMNTVHFAAPELIDDSAFEELAFQVDPRFKPRSKTIHSDTFAFGRLIYEAYAGHQPWTGQALQRIRRLTLAGHFPPREVANALSHRKHDRLWSLCVQCWVKDPFSRPGCGRIRQLLDEASPAG